MADIEKGRSPPSCNTYEGVNSTVIQVTTAMEEGSAASKNKDAQLTMPKGSPAAGKEYENVQASTPPR